MCQNKMVYTVGYIVQICSLFIKVNTIFKVGRAYTKLYDAIS